MAVYLYTGGYKTVCKSGVGKALERQRSALQAVGVPLVETMPPAGPDARNCVVHLNTVLPDSLWAVAKARARDCKVVVLRLFHDAGFLKEAMQPIAARHPLHIRPRMT